jgi:hypothetical protein
MAKRNGAKCWPNRPWVEGEAPPSERPGLEHLGILTSRQASLPDVERDSLPRGMNVDRTGATIWSMRFRNLHYSAGLGSPALRQARMPAATPPKYLPRMAGAVYCTSALGQRSSVVEQQFCKLLVVGSIPTAGSSFLPSVRRLTRLFHGVSMTANDRSRG